VSIGPNLKQPSGISPADTDVTRWVQDRAIATILSASRIANTS